MRLKTKTFNQTKWNDCNQKLIQWNENWMKKSKRRGNVVKQRQTVGDINANRMGSSQCIKLEWELHLTKRISIIITPYFPCVRVVLSSHRELGGMKRAFSLRCC